MSNLEREPLGYSGIFFDSADLKLFERWYDTGILGGATTNPVILNKSEVLNVPEHIQKMVDISGPGFPISIEIPDSTWEKEQMVDLALWYRDRFPDNAVIKIPMDPREPEKAFEVMHTLAEKAVPLNATLGLSSGQLVMASEAMRDSKADRDNCISIFWARREEAKKQMVEKLVDDELANTPPVLNALGLKRRALTKKYNNEIPGAAESLAVTLTYLQEHSLATRIIVGSIRNPQQIEHAFQAGADIVTIPPKLLNEWIYTNRGEETAIQFNEAFHEVEDSMVLRTND